jgi:hypothetical protein
VPGFCLEVIVRPLRPVALDAWRSNPQPAAGDAGLHCQCAILWCCDQPGGLSAVTSGRRARDPRGRRVRRAGAALVGACRDTGALLGVASVPLKSQTHAAQYRDGPFTFVDCKGASRINKLQFARGLAGRESEWKQWTIREKRKLAGARR